MMIGFCHYHKYPLTLRQMKGHKCLSKNGSWCKRFEPNLKHPWWENRIKAGRSKCAVKPFMKRETENKPQTITCYGICTDKCGGYQDGKCVLNARKTD